MITVISKGRNHSEFPGLCLFKWTTLVGPSSLPVINKIGVLVGILDAITNSYESSVKVWQAVHCYMGDCPSVPLRQRKAGEAIRSSYHLR